MSSRACCRSDSGTTRFRTVDANRVLGLGLQRHARGNLGEQVEAGDDALEQGPEVGGDGGPDPVRS